MIDVTFTSSTVVVKNESGGSLVTSFYPKMSVFIQASDRIVFYDTSDYNKKIVVIEEGGGNTVNGSNRIDDIVADLAQNY